LRGNGSPPRAVGSPLLRVEDEPLVRGAGRYVADVDRPDQVYARVVRSPVAHGEILQVNVEDAGACEGVVGIYSATDLPHGGRLEIPLRVPSGPAAHLALQPPLAVDRVRYVGEPVAVVVATDPYLAEDAAELVWAEIEQLDPVLDLLEADAPGQRALHDALPGNLVEGFDFTNGIPVDDLIPRADVVVRERFHCHRHSAAPMEPRGLVAEVDAETSRLTVWGPTKVKHFNRRALAGMLGLPEERIRFIETDVGGGFGPRGEFYPEDFLVPWLALKLGLPVKWVEDRSENLVALNHSREHVFDVEVAATAAGELLALRCNVRSSLGAYVRTNGMKLAECAALHAPGPYAWRGFHSTVVAVLTNKTPAGTFRGPGEVEATFARERMLDLLAERLGIEPDALRRKNLLPVRSLPLRVELGPGNEAVTYDAADYHEMFDALLRHADLDELKAERDRRRAAGEAVGIGIGCGLNEGGYGPFEEARVVAEPDRTFSAHVGVAAIGQGARTALSQILADELGVEPARVTVDHHDTDLVPDGVGAFADRATVVGGSAVVIAARALKQAAKRTAAGRLGVAEDELELRGDEVVCADGRLLTFAELGCEQTGRYEKESVDYSFCASLALVRVERGTGRVVVERYVGAYDVGRAVNPLIVKGQLDGAAAQGLSGGLFEEFAYDEAGQPLATTFESYVLPTLAELPEVESLWFGYPSATNPLGVKGAGGPGIICTHAALANAVADALASDGVEVRRLPLTPGNVRELIRSATQAGMH
jgi:carbon-monoxide dehydrogenase large subunit